MKKTKYKASELLEQSAEQLALRHQQRLHQMTREAVYGKRAASSRHNLWRGLRRPVAVATPALALLGVVLIWQLSQQTTNNPPALQLAADKNIPAWVKDTEVPLAVLQNIEFYQWLENELDNPNHT